jgi:peptidoglycan/LPS O-acetylase OafA/YrhL
LTKPSINRMHATRAGTASYLAPLTGIRALAALLVLGMHADQNIPVGLASVLPFFTRGYLGVDFFFVLSGFIITHVYFSNLARPSRSAIQVFLWHRFIRLYPVHLTILALLIGMLQFARVVDIPINHPQEWRGSQVFWQLTLLHAWGTTREPGWNVPSWSISAEWFAYLLFPLLAPALMYVRERAVALVIAVTALAATAVLFACADWSLNTWVGAPVLARVSGEFLCGAALRRALEIGAKPRSGDVLGIAAFATFLIGASAGVPDFALVALLAVTIFCAATAAGPLAQMLASAPLIWLGEVSYSVYMVHFPVLLVFRRVSERLGFGGAGTVGQALNFVTAVATVILMAAILFYLVERPARRRLRDQFGELAPA